jgi:hypothetical protein
MGKRIGFIGVWVIMLKRVLVIFLFMVLFLIPTLLKSENYQIKVTLNYKGKTIIRYYFFSDYKLKNQFKILKEG